MVMAVKVIYRVTKSDFKDNTVQNSVSVSFNQTTHEPLPYSTIFFLGTLGRATELVGSSHEKNRSFGEGVSWCTSN